MSSWLTQINKDVKQVDQLRANKIASGRKIHYFKDFSSQMGLSAEVATYKTRIITRMLVNLPRHKKIRVYSALKKLEKVKNLFKTEANFRYV